MKCNYRTVNVNEPTPPFKVLTDCTDCTTLTDRTRSVTPLCNRPCRIYILIRFLEKRSPGRLIFHWVFFNCLPGLFNNKHTVDTASIKPSLQVSKFLPLILLRESQLHSDQRWHLGIPTDAQLHTDRRLEPLYQWGNTVWQSCSVHRFGQDH